MVCCCLKNFDRSEDYWSVFPESSKKCELCKIFYGIFSLLFGDCKWRFLIFKLTAFLFGCSIRRNAIFSSSGAVSSKLPVYAEVWKVAEKDALCYLKISFVSFVLEYTDKKKKTLGSFHVVYAMTFFLFLLEIAQNLE